MLHGILYERHLSHLSLCLLLDLCVYFTIYYYYKSQFTLISSKRRRNGAKNQLSSEVAATAGTAADSDAADVVAAVTGTSD